MKRRKFLRIFLLFIFIFIAGYLIKRKDENIIFKFSNKLFKNIEVNIKQFGADESATDNVTAIQSAINYVASAGGGTVIIPKGTYNVLGGVKTIILKSNVKIKGEGIGVSTIRISDKTNDWASLFYHGDQTLYNIGFEDFTVDCNNNLPVTTTEHWVSSRIPFHLGGGYNYKLNNLKIICNGIWGIRAKMANSQISNVYIENNVINITSWFDQSLIWFSGKNNKVFNNTIKTNNSASWIAQTGIEFQGHYNHVYDNTISGFKNGLLFTASTSYKKDYYVDKELGSIGNNIYDNDIIAIRNGIEIWGMNVEPSSVIKQNQIHDNHIFLHNSINTGTPAQGISFFIGNSKLKGHEGTQISAVNKLKFYQNTIKFEIRRIDTTMETGDCGMRFNAEIEIDGLEVKNNTVVNCGGIGLIFNQTASSSNWIKNSYVYGNKFKNTKLPVHIFRNVSNLTITKNSFEQDLLYPSFYDNMIETVIFYSKDFPNNRNIKIYDNFIKCISSLKPFYPIFNSPIGQSIYPYTKGMILEQNTPETNTILETSSNTPITVGNEKQILKKDGLYYKASKTSGATIGTLKAADGISNVRIVEMHSNKRITVNDASNIEPNQVIRLPLGYFSNESFIVVAVVGNSIETGNNHLALAPGVNASELVGMTLSYYDDLTKVS